MFDNFTNVAARSDQLFSRNSHALSCVVASSPHTLCRFRIVSLRQWIFIRKSKEFSKGVSSRLRMTCRWGQSLNSLFTVLWMIFTALSTDYSRSVEVLADFSPGTIVWEFMRHKSIVQPTTSSLALLVLWGWVRKLYCFCDDISVEFRETLKGILNDEASRTQWIHTNIHKLCSRLSGTRTEARPIMYSKHSCHM